MGPNKASNISLSEEQIALWEELYPYIVSGNLHALKQKVNLLAIQVLKEQPFSDRIKVSNSTLLTFGPEKQAPYQSKEQYIRSLEVSAANPSKSSADWAEDPMLFALLEKLGYNAQVYLPGTSAPSYSAIVQKDGGRNISRGLQINILNHHNTHWRLPEQDNPGGGDCGCYMAAQQLIKDVQKVAAALPEIVSFNRTIHVEPSSTANIPVITGQQADDGEAAALIQVEIEREKHAALELVRKSEATAALVNEKVDTASLVKIYQHLKDVLSKSDSYLKSGDTYLANYASHIVDDELRENLSAVLQNGKVLDLLTTQERADVHNELIVMLANEAWKEPAAFQYIIEKTGATANNSPKVSTETVETAKETPSLKV